MSPSLSLNYSSQGANGYLGVGWVLGGLSTIERCPRTLAQDGVSGGVHYDANDRFCLGGQRLVSISGSYGADGTEYRTEIDSYSKVISHGGNGNGPSWFEVHTKSGQTLEYGHTSDSQILAQGSSVARTWALSRVADSKSNYYAVSYTNDGVNGQFYPSRIDYTGNGVAGLTPYNSVQFSYQNRPDVVSQYRAGSLIRETVVLSSIRTYSGADLVSIYSFAYQLSSSTNRIELSSVTLCDPSGSCLPATSFGWQAGANNGAFAETVQGLPNGWVFNHDVAKCTPPLVVGDFNGDGKTDYLLIDCNGRSVQYVFIANGDGSFTGQNQGMTNGVAWDFTPKPDPITGKSTNCTRPPIAVGDFNGDGKTDFAVVDCFGNSYLWIFISNGDGSFTGHAQYMNGWVWNLKFPDSCTAPPLVAGDFNGDGRTDFLLVDCWGNPYQYVFMSNGDGSFATQMQTLPNGWRFAFSSSSGCPTPPLAVGDFNGDGKTDYLFLDCFGAPVQYVFIADGDGTFTGQQQASPNGWRFNFTSNNGGCRMPLVASGDFNGDGISDFAVIDCIGQSYQYVFISKGDGTFTGQTQALPNGWRFDLTNYTNPVPPLLVGDFNGDGKSDYLVIDVWGHPYQYAFLNNGDGSFSGQTQILPNGASFATPNAMIPVGGDFNGDGRSEDLMIGQSGDPYLYTCTSMGPLGDLIVSISTGTGAQTNLTYLPLSSSTVYSKDGNAAYPLVDIQPTFYVVSRVDSSNGIGGAYSLSYSYIGAKVDLTGRGMLGFRQMTIQDLQTNIVQTAVFNQAFPFTGLAGVTTRVLGPQTVSKTTTYFQVTDARGAASVSSPSLSGAPYRVSVSSSVGEGADLDGSALPTKTASYQYDGYGNPTQVTSSTSDGFNTTTVNTYSNDPSLWYLGRLTRATVTSQRPQ